MPENDTTARPALDLAAIEREHARIREQCVLPGCQLSDYQCTACDRHWPCDAALLLAEVRRLQGELQAAREEIAYHHQESARWAARADGRVE